MGYVKRIAGIFLFILLFLLMGRLFDFLIVDDTQSYTRLTMKEMYEQKNIDVLLLGSSHCYRSIIPQILDENWNKNTFNAGTSSQQTDGSYYLLKEANKFNKIEKVYVEVYYDVLCENEEYNSQTAAYIISDYMKSPLNKFKYVWESGKAEYLSLGLIRARRDWEKIFDFSYTSALVEKKLQKPYRQYEYIYYDDEYYDGKGYVCNETAIDQGSFNIKSGFSPISENAISEKSKTYLSKIINYCKKEEIELVFFSAPMPDFRLIGVGNYDSYIEQMKSFLYDFGVPYYDFNLCKENLLQFDDIDFMDNHHLNGRGANKFSEAFAQIMVKDNPSEAFYSSYDEKVKECIPEYFGIIYECKGEEEMKDCYIFTPVTSSDMDLYYSIYKRGNEEEKYRLIEGYSNDTSFYLPKEECGYVYINISFDKEGTQTAGKAQLYFD